MSTNKNPDAMNSTQGEFRGHVRPSEPLTTKGHKPGVLVGNDNVPEFHAEAHEPGTAPKSRTFQPQPSEEVPGQANNGAMKEGTRASDTIIGATSGDVHRGYGHPGAGQTSQELHGKKKHEGSGLEGVGANASDPIHNMGADRDYETAKRGKGDADYPTAEDREPVSAETVASERRG